jgi:crotonobetainyl-CoA:carnitine CoA-transferase CaiB-like acyl-CoA transferase
VLDAPELAVDPRFATNVERVRHRAECDAAVGARTVRWTSEALDFRLVAAGIPSAQVKALKQVVNHDQLRARDRWRTIRTENAEVPALLPPITFADTEARMGDVPALGEHTRDLIVEAGFEAIRADELIAWDVARQSEHRTIGAL